MAFPFFSVVLGFPAGLESYFGEDRQIENLLHLHHVAILLLPAGRGSRLGSSAAYWRAPIG